MPDRYRAAPALEEAAASPTPAARTTPAAPSLAASSRGLQRLRALVVCLSFAVSLPTASWELSWPVRAVASLVSAAVGVAALSRSAPAALAARGMNARQPAVLVAQGASGGAVCAPAHGADERAPGFDGRWLYLEQCTLSC